MQFQGFDWFCGHNSDHDRRIARPSLVDEMPRASLVIFHLIFNMGLVEKLLIRNAGVLALVRDVNLGSRPLFRTPLILPSFIFLFIIFHSFTFIKTLKVTTKRRCCLTVATLLESFQTGKTQVLGGKILKYSDRTRDVLVLLCFDAQCTAVTAFTEIIPANKRSKKFTGLALAKEQRGNCLQLRASTFTLTYSRLQRRCHLKSMFHKR